MERESKTLEYKQEISKTFLKTVSAYANYNDGRIIFGVTDNLDIVGIENTKETCLTIENMINETLEPIPNYNLEIKGNKTIELTVHKGPFTPYYYKGKAFKRNDSSTVEVERVELNRLVLEGSNLSFDQVETQTTHLKFTILEKELKEKLQINRINNDILKTLELMDKNNVYNNGASLIADKNSFPGIDIIRFGRNINEIRDRVTYECQSLLNQFHGAIETFKKYYVFEKITGTERTTVETIPLKAFREAIANALVHRAWDVKASILVKMFEDRIEISSPGGLPYGISKEDYINGHFSIFRNPIIGNIFFRLHYIEKFGTGIVRIKSEYNSSIRKPSFSITSEAIIVTLPILSITYNTTETEKDVLMLMESGSIMNREQISQQLDLDKSTTIRLLNKMIEKELLIKEGNGRGTKYHI